MRAVEDAIGLAVMCAVLFFFLWQPLDAPQTLLTVGFFAGMALHLIP